VQSIGVELGLWVSSGVGTGTALGVKVGKISGAKVTVGITTKDGPGVGTSSGVTVGVTELQAVNSNKATTKMNRFCLAVIDFSLCVMEVQFKRTYQPIMYHKPHQRSKLAIRVLSIFGTPGTKKADKVRFT
jgi:hypothetical protein